MRLYDYAASGNCFKVRLLLGLLGREYERVPVDIFAGDTLTDAYAALNPLRETPVLELDDGRRLAQSNAILWYLARGHAVPAAATRSSARRSSQWLSFEQERVMGGIGGPRFRALTGRAVDAGAAGDRPRGARACSTRTSRRATGWSATRRHDRRPRRLPLRQPLAGRGARAARRTSPPGWTASARCRASSTTSSSYPDNARPRQRKLDLCADDPTIYEWGGGREAFARWLNAFYDLVEQDAELAALFGGTRQRGAPRPRDDVVVRGDGRAGRVHRATTAATSTCWPCTAASRSRPSMRLRFVTLLSRAADLAGLPDDPEFRAALMGYAEWGTRLAVHNSQPGAEVAEHAPVPRWGWGVAPPYQP